MTKGKSPTRKNKGLRRKAEKLRSEKGTNIQKMATEDVEKLVHELKIHQIELEMQNEELRKAKDELERNAQERTEQLALAVERLQSEVDERKKAEERISWLASFPELNPNPVVEVDLKGKIYYLNPSVV